MARGEDLYIMYAKRVYRYLFSLSGEADTAEELTQETFYHALKSLNRYRGEASPQVWLCAIAKRLWYKELERRSRTVPLDESLAESMAAPDDTALLTEKRDDRMRLYRAMQKLDADTREVIHLRIAGDFSFRDIGEILGRSEVWARVRFYRGRQELSKIIGGEDNE